MQVSLRHASVNHVQLRRPLTCLQVLSNVIDAFQIRESAVPDARYEHVPMLIDVADEIHERRREWRKEFVHVPVCQEEETVNDQEGRKVSDHGRCPWCGVAWRWNAQDISVCRRVQEGGKTY